MTIRNAMALGAFVCLCVPLPPAVATINYPDIPGAGPQEVDFLNISETSVTDLEPLFGQPVRQGNQLLFFPQTFASSAADGLADTTAASLHVSVRAPQGHYLEKIHFVEYGDYSLAGSGGAATSARVSGTLFITDVDPGLNGVIFDVMTASPSSGVYSLPGDGFGQFSAVTEVDLTGLGIREVQVSLNNNLQTTSEPGTTAFIQKKVQQGPAVGIIVIPEPASALLLMFGALAVARRRARD